MAALVVKYLTTKREEAAIAVTQSLLDAMKEKDVNRVMQYLDYNEVVSELDMWAKIGGGDFSVGDMQTQMKRNLEKGEFDYEILDAEARYGGEVKVTAKIKEDCGVKDVYFIMKKKDGKWKCNLMATYKEKAKIEK